MKKLLTISLLLTSLLFLGLFLLTTTQVEKISNGGEYQVNEFGKEYYVGTGQTSETFGGSSSKRIVFSNETLVYQTLQPEQYVALVRLLEEYFKESDVSSVNFKSSVINIDSARITDIIAETSPSSGDIPIKIELSTPDVSIFTVNGTVYTRTIN
jgi:hypothetical protein